MARQRYFFIALAPAGIKSVTYFTAECTAHKATELSIQQSNTKDCLAKVLT